MIDIVTVVFREELPVLKLQAESIDLYCQDMSLGNIIVVINDDSMSTADVDPAWYGSMAKQVKIVHRHDLGGTWADNGWLTQQLCKLLASADIKSSTWTMVLDAKTILVQAVDLKRLFNERGQLTWGYGQIAPVFDPSRRMVSELFEINQTDVAGPAGIPFFFNNQIVRDMIKEIERRTNKLFATWFQEAGMITEFILYSGYVQYQYGSLDHLYTTKFNNAYTLCNVCHSEFQRFDLKFVNMQELSNLTVSIHRNAWSQLNQTQRTQYQEFLLSKGITRAKDLV
jgi:Family of unknown function (DUF6492)